MSRPEKRYRPVGGDSVQQSSNKKPKLASQTGTLAKHRNVVVAEDALVWKEVSLPDRLEDAEGFLGLEEIEDVEILRDVGQSNVRFKVRFMSPSCEVPF